MLEVVKSRNVGGMADEGAGRQVNGPAIKAIREALGATQADIATEAGIADSYLSLLEAGKRLSPNREAVAGLIRALRVRDRRAILLPPYKRCRCSDTDEAAS